MTKNWVIGVFLVITGTSCSSDKPSYGDVAIQDVYNEFLSCHDTTTKEFACNSLISKAVCVEFGISDFEKADGFMTETEMINFIKSKWTVLGSATDGDILLKAHKKAESGGAVVAFNPDKKNSGIAVVRKGEMTFSRSWKMDCPNSAFFHQVQPDRSFLRKSLAYCFSKPDGLVVYMKD